MKAGRLAQTANLQSLWQSTCSSQGGNLLIKSLDEDLYKEVREIISLFNTPKHESLLLRLGGTKLKNFPDTRFCYIS